MTWAFLTFSLPREPSAPRVAVWRKLKQLGSVCVHDGPWVLPATKAAEEHFRWLASEIKQKGGEAMLWRAEGLSVEAEARLIRQFHERSESEYRAVLSALESGETRSEGGRRFVRVQKTDYFHVPLGQEVLAKLKGGAT